MKKVMVFGTFDIIHKGHKNFFKQAKKYGDYLIVVVARDRTVKEVKGELPKNSEKIRLSSVIKSRLVNKAVLGNVKNKYKKIKEFKPDVICLGYDQQYFTDKLKNKLQSFGLNTKIIKLKPYKPKIYKTSIIRNYKIKN
jgi:FAD synthetase